MVGAGSSSSPLMVLAIDTSLGATSACLLQAGAAVPLSVESVPMERGHAEALLPMIDRVVSRAPDGFGSIGRVAVTVGPGSFTGIRVGVAAARAIGLACDVPVVGVSTLAALAAPVIATGYRPLVAAAIDARHNNVYIQSFSTDGGTQVGPAALSVADALRALGRGPFRLVGSAASIMAIAAWSAGVNADVDEKSFLPDIVFVARLGLLADPTRAVPKPVYLKPPDAAPPTTGILARLP